MIVYRLEYGTYEDCTTVGLYTTRQLAKTKIVEDALNGYTVSNAVITEEQVQGAVPADEQVRVGPIRELSAQMIEEGAHFGVTLSNLLDVLVKEK